LKALKEAFAKNKLQDEARRITSEKAGVGWSSGSHTALPVLTTAGGPGAETFHGYMDNTEIAPRLKKLYE
jgi:alkaline phosphatase